MNGYLGATEINIEDSTKYKEYSTADFAMYFIRRYGQIEGGHHKAWVMDQVARILKGTPLKLFMKEWIFESRRVTEFYLETGEPSKEYLDWAKDMLGYYDPIEEEYEYTYDEGIAP